MKKLARKKKTNNVLSIADNPRFEPKETVNMVIPKNSKSSYYDVWKLCGSCFGYPDGSKFIVRERFDISEIDRSTIVFVDEGNGVFITAGVTENVVGVVDFVQIDLRRSNK